MKVHTATLAGGENNQDRVFVSDDSVVVLDGASAFGAVDVDPGLYAETLGRAIVDRLESQPHVPIAEAVSAGIAEAVKRLSLVKDSSPSSTVTVFRSRSDMIDLYVLGDSPLYYGCGRQISVLTDVRLASLCISERLHCYDVLSNFGGFTSEHLDCLDKLQRAQREHCNVDDGYWIAEVTPSAALHGYSDTLDRGSVEWAVLATDGASDVLDHLETNWARVATLDHIGLTALLVSLDRWEKLTDPNGKNLKRAKRHDDKTLAVVRLV